MFGRWRKRGEKHRADEQQGDPHALDREGDPHALDREGDPRGGVQSDEYPHAAPTELVEDDGVVMSGPAGAPQDDER
jgi:hypothetical protein